jgi:tetratricopeptide (TPR) repeat protein
MKPLDCLKKRDMLASPKFDPDTLREYAESYFAEERYGEAFAFFRKAADTAGVDRVKAKAIELGDPELLWRIQNADREGVARGEWLVCGESAEKMGKLRSALYCFQRIGETDRATAVEAVITAQPPAAAPAK